MNKHNHMKRLALAGAFLCMSLSAKAADATDISGVITQLDTYRSAALAVGVAVLLFVLGRTIVRKIAK